MAEKLPVQEVLTPPANVTLLEGLISDESVQQRAQWLNDSMAGEYDVSMAHVGRLREAEKRHLDLQIQADKEGDIPEALKRQSLQESTHNTLRSTFGDNAMNDFSRCEQALREIDRGKIQFWGPDADKLFNEIVATSPQIDDGIDGQKEIPPTQRSEATREDFRAYLSKKLFIPQTELQGATTTDRHVSLLKVTDSPYEIPVANLVSAGALSGWEGNGRKAYTRADGVHVEGNSSDAIMDYATRPTDTPPLETIDAYLQPNGVMLFCAQTSNHRAAAAIARGAKTIKVDGTIQIYLLDKNIVEQKNQKNGEPVNWDEVLALAEDLNFHKDEQVRAKQVAKMTAADLVAMTTLVHSKLAPSVASYPTDDIMKIKSPDGSVSAEALLPEDRYAYYEHASSLIGELAQKLRPGNEKDFLERASNIVALCMLIAHPFEDGNGRTARFTAHLIREGMDQTEDTKADLVTLGTNRSTEGFRINSFIPRLKGMTPEVYLKAIAALDVPLSDTSEAYQDATNELYASPYN